MIHAKYDDDRRTVRSTIDGSVLDIVGELAALIEAVRNTLKEQYNETAVDEVIVNIGRAAYSEEPQRVEDICQDRNPGQGRRQRAGPDPVDAVGGTE